MLSMANWLAIGSAIAGLQVQQPALSQSVYVDIANSTDFFCFMETNDGQVINLSSMCGNRGSANFPSSALSRVDQRFLQRYQGLLQRRTVLPGGQALLTQAQQNPQSVIDRAKATCTGARQAQPIADRVTTYLFQVMATQQFCGNLDD